MGLFGSPSVTAPPPAPPPAPMLASSVTAAGNQAGTAARASGAFGGDGTILTGPGGTGPASTGGKKLLGD